MRPTLKVTLCRGETTTACFIREFTLLSGESLFQVKTSYFALRVVIFSLLYLASSGGSAVAEVQEQLQRRNAERATRGKPGEKCTRPVTGLGWDLYNVPGLRALMQRANVTERTSACPKCHPDESTRSAIMYPG